MIFGPFRRDAAVWRAQRARTKSRLAEWSGCAYGGGLNLNVHFHTLVLDGVFFTDGEGETLRFRPAPPPTDAEVGVVLATIYTRVRRLLRRRGFDGNDAELSRPDPAVEDSPVLAGISSASIQGRIALGRRAGARIWRVGEEPPRRGCCPARRGTRTSPASICARTWPYRRPIALAWNNSVAICSARRWRRIGSSSWPTAGSC